MTDVAEQLHLAAECLGISKRSTQEEIDQAFLLQALLAHPDTAGIHGETDSTTQFQELNAAKDLMLQHAKSSSERPTTFLFAGNPGAGKSTLMNGLIGDLVFKSGVSFGGGMTYKLDTYHVPPHLFCDTPGLADVKLREQAAQSITEALKQGGIFKIIFVITLEAGRLRPQDVATVSTILDAAPINNSYGIIVNKIPVKTATTILENPAGLSPSPQERLFAEFITSVPKFTQHITFLTYDEDMVDENDKLCDLPDHLRSWIASIPVVDIDAKQVSDVRIDQFEAIQEKCEAMMAELRSNNAALQKRLEQEAETMKCLQASVSAAQASVSAARREAQAASARAEEAEAEAKRKWDCVVS